jgi:hypothetical protein
MVGRKEEEQELVSGDDRDRAAAAPRDVAAIADASADARAACAALSRRSSRRRIIVVVVGLPLSWVLRARREGGEGRMDGWTVGLLLFAFPRRVVSVSLCVVDLSRAWRGGGVVMVVV